MQRKEHMKSAPAVATRFREVFLNGTFVANTNFQAQLTGLGWEQATTPVGPLHTIAVLTQHIHYYIRGLIQVLQGGRLAIKDAYSFDFSPILSQQQWEGFLTTFRLDAEHFAALVEAMPDEKLQAEFVEAKYGSYQRNIDAVIEHGYYHLGQIVLLKKLLQAS
jgi:uncharacterized damage-inducible protein DinB